MKKNKHLQDLAPDMEVEDNIGEAVEENNEPTPAEEAQELVDEKDSEIDRLTADLDTINAALEKEKKEYLFLMAEFDNFRKRTVREKADIIKNAAEKVLGGLLPIIDDFERGLEANKSIDDADTVKQGMELIYQKLVKYLEQNGVKVMDTAAGTDFNADLHEAIAMVPAETEDKKGKIIDTATRGYTLNNDKVLRHAKVVVAQ